MGRIGSELEVQGISVRFPKKYDLSFYPKTSISPLGFTQAPSKFVPGDFFIALQPDHSPPYRLDFKNVWSYNSTLARCLNDTHKDNFV